MSRVIANALFFDVNNGTTVNSEISGNKLLYNYIVNSFVSLFSAKVNNPNCDCCLFTNVKLDEKFEKKFCDNNIIIENCSITEFDFGSNNSWQGAFFKLDAANQLAKKYDQVMILDTDTVIIGNCDLLWRESKKIVSLYDVDYPLLFEKRQLTIKEFKKIYGYSDDIEHWGGEIICGNCDSIKVLIDACKKVFNKIVTEKIEVDKMFGQEALISIAIYNENINVGRANKYLCRLSTGRNYEIITSYNNKLIWHLISEKNRGMIKLYKYIVQYNKLPPLNKMEKIFHLHKKRNKFEIGILGFKKFILILRNK